MKAHERTLARRWRRTSQNQQAGWIPEQNKRVSACVKTIPIALAYLIREQKVFWLDVAMDHVLLVTRFQRTVDDCESSRRFIDLSTDSPDELRDVDHGFLLGKAAQTNKQ